MCQISSTCVTPSLELLTVLEDPAQRVHAIVCSKQGNEPVLRRSSWIILSYQCTLLSSSKYCPHWEFFAAEWSRVLTGFLNSLEVSWDKTEGFKLGAHCPLWYTWTSTWITPRLTRIRLSSVYKKCQFGMIRQFHQICFVAKFNWYMVWQLFIKLLNRCKYSIGVKSDSLQR